MIPEDAPVRELSAQLEELDYRKLYRAYSPKGRKSAAEPRVLFKVLVHGYLSGIYSSRRLETESVPKTILSAKYKIWASVEGVGPGRGAAGRSPPVPATPLLTKPPLLAGDGPGPASGTGRGAGRRPLKAPNPPAPASARPVSLPAPTPPGSGRGQAPAYP